MIQSGAGWCWKLGLAISLAISGALTYFGNCTLAQIVPDSSLGAESSQVTSKSPGAFQIDGGATRGKNLFHSFSQFSVPTNGIAYFNNALDIQNIISRVTGGSVSNIDGLLRAKGTANLFLINPNGIIFGPNASLNIGGSFLATTASSLNFADGIQFSATATQTTPLLTISVPIGLQFGGNPGSIRNLSQASPDGATNSIGQPVGLQVQAGQTLALIGGDVALEGGNLTAASGRIELGSFAGNSLVSLNQTGKGWALSYEGVQNFQNIQLTHNGSEIPSYVDASGEPGGDVQVQGKRLMLTNGSQILDMTQGAQRGGDLTVTASESVELSGTSNTSNTLVATQTTRGMDTGGAGNITINTGKLILQDGGQVLSTTSDQGSGGQLTVNASESVEMTGTSEPIGTPSAIGSTTFAAGHAGNLKINTRRLLIQDGAQVSAESSEIRSRGKIKLATGGGGDLTVNALDSVELIGTGTNGIFNGLLTSTKGAGDAGDLKIATGALIVRDGAAATVSSQGTGAAGNLEVRARSIRLDNQGQLTATSASGKRGGNITLQIQDLLVMRRNSQISTTAGTANTAGNGGNITLNTPLLVTVPAENSDITANAFTGQGGFIQITAQGIFGIERREKLTPLSDITAFSQKNPELNGVVQINTLGINPVLGLVNLPVQPVDVTGLIAQGCPADVGPRASKFVVTGRGGLPPTPREATRSEPALADLGTTVQGEENHASAATSTNPTSSDTAPLVEAQGWVTNAKGEVVLVAQAPTVTPDIPWLTPTTCHAP